MSNPLQIDAGQLRHRIAIQYNAGVADPNAMNTSVANWTTRNQVSASIEPLTAREYIANSEIQGDVSHKITIRYDPNISNTDRIQDENGVLYNITGILNVLGRNKKQIIMALQNE